MYRNCIFCSSDLGSNNAIPSFPIGAQVAFDAWKGRLWAVCPRCARWNLAPIEERWEPVEEAEKQFRDSRMRVQSENVGVAQLPDGTRLIRIGEALPGELAAWRYGRELLRRRHNYLLYGAAAGAGAIAVAGLSLAGIISGGAVWSGLMFLADRSQQKVVARIPAENSSDPDIIVRRWHVDGISILPSIDAPGIHLEIRDGHLKRQWKTWDAKVNPDSTDVTYVSGDRARTILSRAMTFVNKGGATRARVTEANETIAAAGTSDRALTNAIGGGLALGKKAGRDPNPVTGVAALALEMALNEQNERNALEGELTALKAAWREAEEIAEIADALPFGLDKLR